MNKVLFVFITLFSVFGCIKAEKKIHKNSSSKINTAASEWFLMGGTYQGSGLLLNKKVSTYAGLKGGPGNADGTLFESRFDGADRMTINKKNIYIAEGSNAGIRKINTETGEVTTILKNGAVAGQYYSLTSHGDYLYIFDSINYSIIKVDVNTEAVSILAGKGVAGEEDGYGLNASFLDGASSTMTTDGKFLYLSNGGNRIRKVDVITGHVTSINLEPEEAAESLTTDGKFLYILSYTDKIIKMSLDDNTYSTFYQNSDLEGMICLDGKYLYFYHNLKAVKRVSLSSNVVENLAGDEFVFGYADGEGANARFSVPGSMVSDGKKLYILDTGNDVIRVIE